MCCAPTAPAFVITPNAPADFENPFHVYLFEPEHLVSLLALFFDDVDVPRPRRRRRAARPTSRRRRASGERLLRLDRARPPPPASRAGAYVWAYEHVLPLVYRLLGREQHPASDPGIDESHFFLTTSTSRRHAGALRDRPRAADAGSATWLTGSRREGLGHGPDVDEVENIDLLVRRVRDAVPDAHILVVDDNSPDGTADKAEALGAELGGIEVLRRPRKMGLGSAYRAGHAIGIARGYDVMIQIDADLSHDPADLPRLLAAVERGADLAIGSRYVAGRQRAATGRSDRLLLSVWGNRYAAFVLGLDVRDSTAGYRAYRASILRAMDFETTHSTGYAFQIEMTYRVAAAPAARSKRSRSAFTDRVRGTSKMSWRIVVEADGRVTWWGLRDRVLHRRSTSLPAASRLA